MSFGLPSLESLSKAIADTPSFSMSARGSQTAADGKSMTTGGLDVGGPSAGDIGLSSAMLDDGKAKAVVGLFVGSVYGFAEVYCCGVIGDKLNGKMCVEPKGTCKFSSHSDSKHRPEMHDELPAGSGDSDVVMILVNKSKTSVYIQPRIIGISITPAAFDMLRDRYSADERTKEDWMQIFETLQHHESNEEISPFAEKLSLTANLSRVEHVMKRPLMPKTPMPPKRMKTNPGNLDPDASGWSKVDPTPEELRSMISELRKETAEEFETSDVTAMHLRTFVGHRPDTWGAASLTNVVDGLARDARRVDESVGDLSSAMQPCLKLYSHLSTLEDGTIGQPGQRLFGLLASMQEAIAKDQKDLVERIKMLDQQVFTMSRTPPTRSNQFGQTTGEPAPQPNPFARYGSSPPAPLLDPTQPSQVDPAVLEAAVKAALTGQLKIVMDRVNAVESMTSGGGLSFPGVRDKFRSRHDCIAWCAREGVTEADMVYFCDAHGMLTLGFADYDDAGDVMRDESNAFKAGHTSVNVALLKASFKVPLPAFFGKAAKDDKSTVKDSRVLPRIKQYSYWDDSTGHSGLRHEYDELVKTVSKDLMDGGHMNLSTVASYLSSAVLAETAQALLAMGSWMTGSVQDLAGRQVPNKVAWPLTSHGVRVIMSRLDKARRIGKYSCPDCQRPGTILWGLLQGVKKMREFVADHFGAHPDVSHVLNIYLRDHAVLKDEFKKELQSVTDKVNGKTSKKS